MENFKCSIQCPNLFLMYERRLALLMTNTQKIIDMFFIFQNIDDNILGAVSTLSMMASDNVFENRIV